MSSSNAKKKPTPTDEVQPAEAPAAEAPEAAAKPKRAKPPVRKPVPSIPTAEKLLLTAGEVAALTGLHPDVVYKWGKAGTFPTLRVNRRVRFPRRAIEAWIERNQQGGE